MEQPEKEKAPCEHRVLGPSQGIQETPEGIEPAELHTCKRCHTTKAVKPHEFPDLEQDK